MEVEVTFLSRRGSAVMRRSRHIEARRVRLGRGTGNEIQLPDIRVDLAAAALFPRSGVLTIQALGPSPLRVNGQTTRAAAIGPGDEIVIGPYRILFGEPAPGLDAALAIELAQPMGDALGRLMAHARTGLPSAAISKRWVSWIGLAMICVLFLAGPIIAYSLSSSTTVRPGIGRSGSFNPLALSWEPGEVSNSHRFFAGDCATCHRSAFAAVPDEACATCHNRDNGHAILTGADGNRAMIGTTQCTTCHIEHRGNRGLIVSNSGLCLQCHATLAEQLPALGTRDVPGFAKHPQFRATLVADTVGPRFERALLGSTPPPLDRPGLKFSHAVHLVPGGFPALGYKAMACADCHKREPGGEGFVPVTYKGQCQQCHALTFDRQDLPWPDARVPHGDDAGVAAAVWNFYAGRALQGDVAMSPAASADPRRIPGAPTAVAVDKVPEDTQGWVRAKTEAALRAIVLDDKRGCAYCHFGVGPDGSFDLSTVLPLAASGPRPPVARLVAPVVLRSRFLPHARFDHGKHTAVDCEQCHPVRRAESSAVVLIPGIENCQSCHGAERASQRAESSCITCHRFHQGLEAPVGAAAAAGH